MSLTKNDLAQRIDHTCLKPEATGEHIDALCDEAIEHGFAGVCVNPIHVRRVSERLNRHRTTCRSAFCPALVSVSGFPLGASTTETKADEARRAADDGATEIDMVIRVGSLIESDGSTVRRDIEAVATAFRSILPNGILKVILEAGALTEEQLILGCRCCVDGGADFAKTSTGFHASGGATVDQVRLLIRHASPLRVKASGGLRTASDACAMIDAGAARIGTSAGVAIIANTASSMP